MELPLNFFLAASIIVFFIGVSKSGLAAGIGVLGVPTLSLFVSPTVAAGILLPLLVAIDSTNIWSYRKHYQKRYLVVLIPSALVGIGLGTLVFGKIDPAVVRLLVGLIAVWFASLHFARHLMPKIGRKMPMYFGFFFATISGFTSHLAHAGAPPLRAFLLNQDLPKSQFVGTVGFFFACVNSMKLVPYVAFGQITSQTLWISLLLAPMVPLGVFVGLNLHHRISQVQFTRIAYVLLMIAGVKLLYDGISDLI